MSYGETFYGETFHGEMFYGETFYGEMSYEERVRDYIISTRYSCLFSVFHGKVEQ